MRIICYNRKVRYQRTVRGAAARRLSRYEGDKIMYIPEQIGKIRFTEKEIADKVKELGKELTREYSGKNPIFICVLKGACVFFCDLIRCVECPIEIRFIKATSYIGTRSSGEVKIPDADNLEVVGRDVVLVEDIVDTARTLSANVAKIKEKAPASLRTVCLLDKPSRRAEGLKEFKADYTGFKIDDFFVVGYGLDCDQQYRNLPYIGEYNG